MPTSIRLDAETKSRLSWQAERDDVPPARLAQRLIDEGLKMAAHPGVVFRDGPAGRRPSLIAGPDVAEVVSLIRHIGASGAEVISEAASWLEIPLSSVRAAVDYYAEFTDEVDRDVTRREAHARRAREHDLRRDDLLS